MPDETPTDTTAATQADLPKETTAAAAKQPAAAPAAPEVPTPPKGADFDTIAAIHQDLVAKNSPVADAFHKKHVLGYKGK